MRALDRSLPPTFWAKVSEDPSGCWLWRGALNSKGYGCFGVQGVSQLAHRVAYEAMVGPIAESLTVDHLCRVHRCVNPQHMEIVTAMENLRRGHEARRPTHCPHGHPCNAINTRVRHRPNGHVNRTCRTCEAIARRRKREAVAS